MEQLQDLMNLSWNLEQITMNNNRAWTERRNKKEICISMMMNMSEGPCKPTHLMYRSNLSWIAMQDYLKDLIECGLVIKKEVTGQRFEYYVSELGMKVITLQKQIDALMPFIKVKRNDTMLL